MKNSFLHSIQYDSIDDLVDEIFPNLFHNYNNTNWICERAILTPKNVAVHSFDNSIDNVVDDQDIVNYPIEFLNSLELPGTVPHCLHLRKEIPIMLLHNLSQPKLYNGTKLNVHKLMMNCIEANILTGCGKGDTVFIPHIPVIPSNVPFQFKRLQFPISLSYVMSINKSQGQILKVAGSQLEEPCFSHGQLMEEHHVWDERQNFLPIHF
ncbi:uncharacterized protein LOC115218275 [Octopus sinensis]|uniref:Uncharacterized protein LOC115218275 n=1 Tax=Octopus sinensis TaxID=2607531 RepID=A0A6P7T0E1_9MOLL|nr:uncharacterized protein LOC115218275 [Octopus sinensis]